MEKSNKSLTASGDLTTAKPKSEDCQKTEEDLTYAYKEFRFSIWSYLQEHGAEKTKKLYLQICDEEGVDWTRDAMGKELLEAIGVTGT
jgi:hypothetical protein